MDPVTDNLGTQEGVTGAASACRSAFHTRYFTPRAVALRPFHRGGSGGHAADPRASHPLPQTKPSFPGGSLSPLSPSFRAVAGIMRKWHCGASWPVSVCLSICPTRIKTPRGQGRAFSPACVGPAQSREHSSLAVFVG